MLHLFFWGVGYGRRTPRSAPSGTTEEHKHASSNVPIMNVDILLELNEYVQRKIDFILLNILCYTFKYFNY